MLVYPRKGQSYTFGTMLAKKDGKKGRSTREGAVLLVNLYPFLTSQEEHTSNSFLQIFPTFFSIKPLFPIAYESFVTSTDSTFFLIHRVVFELARPKKFKLFSPSLSSNPPLNSNSFYSLTCMIIPCSKPTRRHWQLSAIKKLKI